MLAEETNFLWCKDSHIVSWTHCDSYRGEYGKIISHNDLDRKHIESLNPYVCHFHHHSVWHVERILYFDFKHSSINHISHLITQALKGTTYNVLQECSCKTSCTFKAEQWWENSLPHLKNRKWISRSGIAALFLPRTITNDFLTW